MVTFQRMWPLFELNLRNPCSRNSNPCVVNFFLQVEKKTSLDPQNEKKGSALNTFKIVTHRRKDSKFFIYREIWTFFIQNKFLDPIVHIVVLWQKNIEIFTYIFQFSFNKICSIGFHLVPSTVLSCFFLAIFW